ARRLPGEHDDGRARMLDHCGTCDARLRRQRWTVVDGRTHHAAATRAPRHAVRAWRDWATGTPACRDWCGHHADRVHAVIDELDAGVLQRRTLAEQTLVLVLEVRQHARESILVDASTRWHAQVVHLAPIARLDPTL